MKKNISILGVGWLGFPLAKKAIVKDFCVKGSTTSIEKLKLLQENNIQTFQILLSEDKIEGKMEEFLANSEILIIDIPPKLRTNASENFVKKIKNLIPYIEKSTIKKVLFISATSVFADTYPISEIDENTMPNATSENGKQLFAVEQLLLSKPNFQTTILRFGGLVGEDRHPIRFLAGKTNIENPDAPINLIHQEDCIAIIEKIIEKNSWDKVYNAVAPNHPTRKKYYTQKAKENNLPLPIFQENTISVGKKVISEKLQKELDYKFLHIFS